MDASQPTHSLRFKGLETEGMLLYFARDATLTFLGSRIDGLPLSNHNLNRQPSGCNRRLYKRFSVEWRSQ